ncbi:MAG: hypothetical protein M1838_003163 [Thelocarpon superellum]|nr:MAG: hypothetical protein M1838_003163 [Thelocarpon superellum]
MALIDATTSFLPAPRSRRDLMMPAHCPRNLTVDSPCLRPVNDPLYTPWNDAPKLGATTPSINGESPHNDDHPPSPPAPEKTLWFQQPEHAPRGPIVSKLTLKDMRYLWDEDPVGPVASFLPDEDQPSPIAPPARTENKKSPSAPQSPTKSQLSPNAPVYRPSSQLSPVAPPYQPKDQESPMPLTPPYQHGDQAPPQTKPKDSWSPPDVHGDEIPAPSAPAPAPPPPPPPPPRPPPPPAPSLSAPRRYRQQSRGRGHGPLRQGTIYTGADQNMLELMIMMNRELGAVKCR